MTKVGLTGGMASGKSTVARMFAARGVETLDADNVARELMQPGQPVYQAVVRHFGPAIVNPDSSINRTALAAIIFPSGRVAELNRLVHPAVITRQNEWLEEMARKEPGGIALVEAALILEAGVKRHFDKLVVVTCKPEQRAERHAKRLGIAVEAARKDVARRMAVQMTDEEKAAAADYVIDNSGPLEESERQVEKVFQELKRLGVRA